MANITIKSANAVSARRAECYAIIRDTRYNFMQMIDLEATVEKEKGDIPILGKPMSGNKANGLKGSFKGTAHYNTSIFREMMTAYKDTGQDVYFDMQIINDDPTSGIGTQEVNLIDCNMDSITLVKFDAGGEYLDESVEGTFEDWNMPKTFDLMDGFVTK